ncbi:MAG: hypothetical protein QOD81_143 [Solirubrobacteraceae bacterium]|jgi:hypothetical protein|nr:hypothetical protein [Solirubrobacteraceae bacterium]
MEFRRSAPHSYSVCRNAPTKPDVTTRTEASTPCDRPGAG